MASAKKTGAIWSLPPRSRGQRVRRVCEALEREYGRPRHGNPERPIDDLVYILLSSRTEPELARSVYRELQERFGDWSEVAEVQRSEVFEIVRCAGFGNKRTDQIRGLVRQILRDFGDLESEELWGRDTDKLLDYLTDLHGVSDKIARCVAMYTLDRYVLPVDVHVHRIAKRLGWTNRKRPGQAHAELEDLIPEHRRYAFHVDCVAHGRARCTASNPKCGSCPVRRYCAFVDGPLAPTPE